MKLTGYGKATAQSWLFYIGIQFYSKSSFSSMRDVINISIQLMTTAHVYNHFSSSLLCRKAELFMSLLGLRLISLHI